MATQTSLFSAYPVKHNEGQTHDHEDETQSGETSSLKNIQYRLAFLFY